jgi:anti-sigma B factor antagonist
VTPFSCLRYGGVGTVRVAVAGELDIATVAQVDQALRRAHCDAAPLVVLDLQELEFIDSSGAHLMMATDLRVREAGGRFVVVRGPGVQRLLEVIGIDRRLELVDEPPTPPATRCVVEDEAA